MSKQTKKDVIEKMKNLNPKRYRIYGIFNTKSKKMLYVSMDKEKTKLEFDLGEYGPGCDIVTANVFLF